MHAKQIITTLILLWGIALSARADNSQVYSFSIDPNNIIDSVDYHYLREKYPVIDTAFLSRSEGQILNYEKNDTQRNPITCDIVFTGSSTIGVWGYRIYNDFSPLPVLGRGFGGSTMLEVIYYFKRIMKPYQPKIAVLYCENDIGSDIQRIYELFRYYEYLFHSEFPTSTLYIVSFKPSIARKSLIPQMKSINALLKEYAEIRPNTEFINTFDAMMPNGILDESLFMPDGLHMNSKGYDLWTSIIKPIISAKYHTDTDSTLANNKQIQITQSNGLINIISNENIIRAQMNDLSGAIVLNIKADGIKSINTNKLNKGLYIITLQTAKGRIFRKKLLLSYR